MSRKKKATEGYSYTLIEYFPRKDEIETVVQDKRQLLSLIKKSKGIRFGIQIWSGSDIENEGEYDTKKNAIFAFKCFTEE